MHNFNLALAFSEQARQHPERLALAVAGREVSYGELARQVSLLAGFLKSRKRSGRIGVLGTRSLDAYVGILAACWSGCTYVPLNLKWPAQRLIALMALLELDALVVDETGAALLTAEILAAAPRDIVVPQSLALAPERPGQAISIRSGLTSDPMLAPAQLAPDQVGYVIFTSGTTGLPKGVMISAGSLAHYLDQTRPWTDYRPEDRLCETCDVTFDLSVHNLFLCLKAGASLHVMSELEMLAPARFIRAHAVTVWMSVPTVIGLIRKTGALKPGLFPSLRLSIFCGEPLPVQAAQAWLAATPNGVLENIYGPTEATVICMRQRLTDPPVVTQGRDILAIGRPYVTMEIALLDSSQQPVAPGIAGEIALCGPQVGIGYFGQPELTADRFREINGKRWYLTGDIGYRDQAGVYHHLGRADNQVKVKGNRIELEEVDAHLRRAAGVELIATVAWPTRHGSAEGLVSFVAGSTRTPEQIREAMAASLPRSMIPRAIHMLDSLPQNVNGKIDRRALIALLEEQATGHSPGGSDHLEAATSGGRAL
ncbi:MAG: AMP-binding protein [Hyphomicrobiales bacterium]|nr:AMP-binding protein [Hyphomicrobiales bacterium]